MRLIGRDEQMAIDRLWQEKTGLPLLLLMEAAAEAVCRFCSQLPGTGWESGATVLVLAGKGQNGGDALACARLLHAAGWTVVCRELFAGQELPPEAAANRRAALSLGLGLGPPQEEDFASLSAGSLILDGIFGTGYRSGRPLPPEVAAVSHQVAAARARGARVVAIDVPSGLDANSGAIAADAIQADFTVTFVRAKIGLAAAPGRFAAGQTTVEPIGVPDLLVDEALEQSALTTGRPAYLQITAADLAACRPVRPADSHKGLFGKVLLLGGSAGMPGAIILAAEAAARSGIGLLSIGVPAAIGPMVLSARPEGLLTLLPDQSERTNQAADSEISRQAAAEKAEAVISQLIAGQPAAAVGPGAGRPAWLAQGLTLLIRMVDRLVIDADALNQIADDPKGYFPLLRGRRFDRGLQPAILTPHPGEFRRLAPDVSLEDRQAAARELAVRTGCVVVLKGASTVIAGPEGPILINQTGHDGLARGGSGDVLCGLIAGLLAQGLTPIDAAMAGVYLHGLAADLAAVRLSRRTMLPRDVIDSLDGAFRQIGWQGG